MVVMRSAAVFSILIIAIFLQLSSAYIVNPGPAVKATRGEVWPKPVEKHTEKDFYIINPVYLRFKTNTTCRLLFMAVDRYWDIILAYGVGGVRYGGNNYTNIMKKSRYSGVINNVKVRLGHDCNDTDMPHQDMDESYTIEVSAKNPHIYANTIWGALRGLETFSQLIYYDDDGSTLIINKTYINDKPRFSFRGLLVDTSRHFIPKADLYRNLDAMAYNKLNVFHWHITDDQSFPYQSIKFPELSEYGAYHPHAMVYSQKDVKDIINYAWIRGIRVMVEFDTPGHTRSWGEGIKDILTPCYNNGVPTGKYGPMDPTRDNLYTFIKEFFEEVIKVFPEKYLHLGGDEVEFECWKSNPNITQFMEMNNMIGDYVELESYYIQILVNIVNSLGAQSLVWEEVFSNGVTLPNKTIVHVWKGNGYTVLKQVVAAGKPALLSACWYLDHLATGGDWLKFYNCDPHNINATENELKLILGGEACMWAESVNEHNILSRIWPRASATAEKLWSVRGASTIANAARRLEEHTCRMNARGIPAQPPNGPGYCL